MRRYYEQIQRKHYYQLQNTKIIIYVGKFNFENMNK